MRTLSHKIYIQADSTADLRNQPKTTIQGNTKKVENWDDRPLPQDIKDNISKARAKYGDEIIDMNINLIECFAKMNLSRNNKL